jgi:hypothetical protein
MLKELEAEKEIPRLYKLLSPPQQLTTIFKLRDCAYGRPAVSEEQQKPVAPVQVFLLERIGSRSKK